MISDIGVFAGSEAYIFIMPVRGVCVCVCVCVFLQCSPQFDNVPYRLVHLQCSPQFDTVQCRYVCVCLQLVAYSWCVCMCVCACVCLFTTCSLQFDHVCSEA